MSLTRREKSIERAISYWSDGKDPAEVDVTFLHTGVRVSTSHRVSEQEISFAAARLSQRNKVTAGLIDLTKRLSERISAAPECSFEQVMAAGVIVGDPVACLLNDTLVPASFGDDETCELVLKRALAVESEMQG